MSLSLLTAQLWPQAQGGGPSSLQHQGLEGRLSLSSTISLFSRCRNQGPEEEGLALSHSANQSRGLLKPRSLKPSSAPSFCSTLTPPYKTPSLLHDHLLPGETPGMPRLSEGMTPWAATLPDEPEVLPGPKRKRSHLFLLFTHLYSLHSTWH